MFLPLSVATLHAAKQADLLTGKIPESSQLYKVDNRDWTEYFQIQ